MQPCCAGEEKSKKGMACSFEDSGVCSDTPLKRAQLCPSSLCRIGGGKHRELGGNLKLMCWVGKFNFYLGAIESVFPL